MTYFEVAAGPLHRVELICDAKSRRGVCGHSIIVIRNSREECQETLERYGWRLLRGHQICPAHAQQYEKGKRVRFARKG